MILKFNVKEQTISLVNTKSVPRIGSKDYLVLQFSFSSDWENLDKLVYLQSGDVSQPIDIVDNLVEVPEWFTEQDSFNVTLFGTDGTTEVPTNVVSVQLEKSNDLWQKDAPEPQPSWLVSVLDAAELVKEATVHGPIIGSNGNWYTWDFESKQYIDTGVGASGEGGTTDHTQLTNRNADDQHPMSAITGLVKALDGKVSVADIINNLTTNAANKPLSAAQGVALKALIDDISIPEKLPNPNALTFTGAVTGSYDGSAPLEVEIPSGGGGLTVTNTAAVGQIVKITTVDENGQPTAWKAVDMPSGGSMRWQKIKEITLTEQTNDIVIGEDDNGVSVADYNPIAMKVEFHVPADSTQTSTNGTPWIYPSATNADNLFRTIGSITSWKTVTRRQVEFFIGDIDGIFAGGNVNSQIVVDPSRQPEFTVMDGVTLRINSTDDHWPVGTIVSLEVLSERA